MEPCASPSHHNGQSNTKILILPLIPLTSVNTNASTFVYAVGKMGAPQIPPLYFDEYSPTSSPDDYHPSYLPWTSVTAPSLVQLAHSRAHALDFSTIHHNASFDSTYSKESDVEKQQYDGKPQSPNGSQTSFSSASPVQAELPPELCMSMSQEVAFIFITCLAQFLSLSALNQTVAPVMVLADYFQIEDYGTLSWFSASFSMSVGTFILPAGKTPAER